MPDPESQFLDALYLSVRDLTESDQALDHPVRPDSSSKLDG